MPRGYANWPGPEPGCPPSSKTSPGCTGGCITTGLGLPINIQPTKVMATTTKTPAATNSFTVSSLSPIFNISKPPSRYGLRIYAPQGNQLISQPFLCGKNGY